MNRKNILKYGKVIFTFLILVFILRKADLRAIITTIKNGDYLFILLALSSFALYQLIYAYNWQRILSTLSERIRYVDLLKVHMIGLFYNLFLPTSMGGDVAKIYYLSKKLKDRVIPIKSIALLRGAGFITNMMILGFSLVFHKELLEILGFQGRAVYGVYFLVGMIAVYSLVNRMGVSENRQFRKARSKIQDYVTRFKSFLGEFKIEMYGIIAVSLLNQLIIILENYIILEALDMHIGFIHVMYIVPLTFFATLLPVTIAGIGIREGAFIYFLGRYGYSPENAIAFSLLGYLLILVVGITGGLVHATTEGK